MNSAELIKQKTMQYKSDTLKAFNHLHEHPELSFQEFETSKYIQEQLTLWNIPFKAGYVQTGIVGKIEGKNPSKRVIALRADMDALHVIEEAVEGYPCSKNKGVMHACGHDAHTATLLTVGRILNDLKDQFEGTVILVFQPGEEAHPGGASLMLKEGALDEPKPDLIIGQHVFQGMPVGHVGYRAGRCMASADEVHITVQGIGGHGAMPHLFTDTVLAASRIVVALQDVTSRLAPAFIPTVLSFGKFIADGATNVIPERVQLAGTFRTMDETWRAAAKDHIRRIATKVAESLNCTCICDIKDGYPSVINDELITQKAIAYSQAFLGKENVETIDMRMTAEDFGFYSEVFPSTFFRFGVTSASNLNAGGQHTPQFRIDPQALDTSISNLAYIALAFLNNQ